MSDDILTFSTPCLRWKILAGVKNQYGFPGNVNTRNRYLNLLVTVTADERPLFGPNGPVNVASQMFTIDRFTGLRTPNSLNDAATPLLNFPYNSGLPGSDPGSTWIITETDYKHIVVQSSGVIVTVEGQLSNQYTDDMLDADASALIAAIDPNTVPFFSLTVNTGGDIPAADPTLALPAQYMYGGIFGQNPVPIPPPPPLSNLRAAAWYSFVPGFVGADNWTPNVYMKAISFFAMAGKYCEKTYLIDYSGNPLGNSCISGSGSCANQFEIKPPAFVEGQNAYVLMVPNCVCGG